ncbi:MAG: Large-conductance mechanosensitive channel-like protein [Parcubacteria group bacterium GW2011_GWE2_39_37]|nr:MAG: Large-conductance mechanosensitive channel-like protein [Parcubacteria group bacterium GW2011_GWE2_39_37]
MVIKKTITGFVQFIREQGIVGLAIGFILGTSINKVVTSLVNDLIQPGIGLLFGSSQGLVALQYKSLMYGKFLASMIDFGIIAAVVYFGFKGLKLDRLDVKKEDKK